MCRWHGERPDDIVPPVSSIQQRQVGWLPAVAMDTNSYNVTTDHHCIMHLDDVEETAVQCWIFNRLNQIKVA